MDSETCTIEVRTWLTLQFLDKKLLPVIDMESVGGTVRVENISREVRVCIKISQDIVGYHTKTETGQKILILKHARTYRVSLTAYVNLLGSIKKLHALKMQKSTTLRVYILYACWARPSFTGNLSEAFSYYSM